MRIVYFAHAAASCWNNGNAHFLRGVLRELIAAGHAVRVVETPDNWSAANLRADHGDAALDGFARHFPDLAPHVCGGGDLDVLLDGAELVIAHEWNDPALLAALGARRATGGRFRLLFHDTHHRAVSDPAAIRAMPLDRFDGVLAFGAALAGVYRRQGWGERAFVWHEAADTRLFHPPLPGTPRAGAVWIGNWGDDERGAELRDYLLAPAHALGLPLDIYGVRYPQDALDALAAAGARYRGWLANARAPAVFARHAMTVHVPRRWYADRLAGIPTIRVFEALACGIPLISAPWRDEENLFTVGRDFLMAKTPAQMQTGLRALRDDPELRLSLAAHGHATVLGRHTCAHRAAELLAIAAALGAAAEREAA